MSERRFVVIGGGPAGLTAALELCKNGHLPVVLEKGARLGGLARTEEHRGYRFDLGGHRFFTKVAEVEALWRETIGADFLRRPRLSRIYYRRRFFNYPLKVANVLGNLGLFESALVMLSWLRSQLFPSPVERSFEQWVTNRFGARLFRTFFKTYTEKVWGISCSELSAEWAAQRIKDLSMRALIVRVLLKPQQTIKTLIEEFDYPRLGPGMMWEAFGARVEAFGGVVRRQSEVLAVHHDGGRVEAVSVRGSAGAERLPATDVISSMPLSELVQKLDPPPPAPVLTAARALRYRDFLTVCLILDRADAFPDNWIYVHEPEVLVGRIQNFRNWSPDLCPEPGRTALGLEYFCNEGDALWTASDAELVERGKQELERIGLGRAADVVDGCVVRVPKSYPVYDETYATHLQVLRECLKGLPNLHTIGRNGLHRYNNQDHSMLTGLFAVRNALTGAGHDLWSVNVDDEYHEEDRLPDDEVTREALAPVLEKADPLAAGAAAAVVGALGVALATAILMLKGGDVVGPRLALLAQFLPGYYVSPRGVLAGALWTGFYGFVAGAVFASARNAAIFLFALVMGRAAVGERLRRFLEFLW